MGDPLAGTTNEFTEISFSNSTSTYRMHRFHARVDAGFRALVMLLGSWALYAQACVLAQASFATIRALSFLPLVFSIIVLWKTSRSGRSLEAHTSVAPPAQPRSFLRVAMGFGAPFAITIVYAVTRLDALFWLLATIYLTAQIWFGQHGQGSSEVIDPPESRGEVGVLLALCAVAALLTSGASRPDPDDAYYVNVATAVVEFPDAAPQSFDALHRSALPPVEQALHLPEVYEILVGLLSSVSGVSIPALYYVVLPPLWAVLGTLANWLVLRHLLPRREAIWGTAIWVFLLVFWGDGHRTFGHFGFVRLFQGKAIYVTVMLPLVVLAALRYRQRPGVATWLTLAFIQCAAAGLTTNGVVVAPLAVALALLAPGRIEAQVLRTTLFGIAASVPLLVGAAAMYIRMAPYLSAVNVDAVLLGYGGTLGSTRAPLILLALTLLPLLAVHARLKSADWIGGYMWLVVLVIFLPATSRVASTFLGHVYSWRLFWAVPVPLLVGLAGGVAAGAIGARKWLPAGALVAWVTVFAFAGPMAVSRDVFSVHNVGRLKVVDASYAVAKETVALARPDALALVPEAIAIYVTGFPHAPPLVGVRNLYLRKLRGFIPSAQLASRDSLFRYSTGTRTGLSVGTALRAIEEQGIATVVFPESHRDASALVSELTGRGFSIHPVRGFLIAVLPR